MAGLFSAVSSFLGPERTELEKKLDTALSKENWGAPTSLLREIAEATRDRTDFAVIMKETWASLDHAGKNWRQIYKVRTGLGARCCGRCNERRRSGQ